jgi:hypothetical protein
MGEQISIGGFEARFYNVKTPMGLVLTEARVKGVNTIISHKPLHVEMLKPGDIEAHINEQALAVFLNEEAPGGLQNFQVELKDGKIALQATMTMIIPIKAGGRRLYASNCRWPAGIRRPTVGRRVRRRGYRFGREPPGEGESGARCVDPAP